MKGEKIFRHNERCIRNRKRVRSAKSPRETIIGEHEIPLRSTSSLLSSAKSGDQCAEQHSHLPRVDASANNIPEDKFADPEECHDQDIRVDDRSASGCRPTANEVKYLDLQILELYLKPEEAEEFMKQADLAGNTADVMRTLIVLTYSFSETLENSVAACSVVSILECSTHIIV